MADIKIGIGTEGVPKTRTELKSIVDEGEKVVATNEKIEKSNQKVSNSYKGTGGNIRNTAYQLQDIAVQLQAGTSATTVLSQQLPQLLSSMGLVGVVAGAAAAGLGLLISATDLFSSKTEKLVKQQKSTIASLKESVDLIDQFSQGTKLLTTTSADAFEQWLGAFRKANEEGKKELLDFLKLQKIINDAAEEEARKEVDRIKERRKNLSDLNRQMGLSPTLGFGMPFSPITDAALADAELKLKKLSDFQKRTDAALSGDYGTATSGGSAQTAMQTTLQQRIQGLQAEAQYIGVSNAEREYGVMLAELEAQAKRTNTTLDQKQIALLKDLVFARDASRSTDKIIEYTREQEREIGLLRLEGQAVTMSAFQYKQLSDARKLEAQLMKDTVGMQPAQAEAYKENARLLFLQKQNLEQVNEEQRKAFGTGSLAALKKYKEDLSDVAKSAEALFTNAFKGIEDAMVSAFQGGKLSFRSMIDAMIADISRMIVRQALLRPLYQAMGLGGGAGGSLGSSLVMAGLNLFGNAGTAFQYGTNIGSQQTNMLAAQNAGLPMATGTNYVPYDGFQASLHKGEAVVPAKYNPAAGGTGGSNITYSPTINIDSRTDQADVRRLVTNAMQQSQLELVDKINRGQVKVRQ